MKVEKFNEDYIGYLNDESRRSGTAEAISFPQTQQDVIETIHYCNESDMPLTVQGFRTGIGGGCVPNGGCILNFERFNKIKGIKDNCVICEGGVTLLELSRYIAEETDGAYFLPPDPTEQTATVGGAVSCNASGAKSFGYGPIRDYVQELQVVLADGLPLKIRRGEIFASGRTFTLPLKDEAGTVIRVISGELPTYQMPKTKNAAGYYVKDNMDLIDLFIGSQGTLGVITQVELKLMKSPERMWGMVCFFAAEASAIKFSQQLRGLTISAEFFDKESLQMSSHHKNIHHNSAVFIEYEADSEATILEKTKEIGRILSECGGDVNQTWIANNRRDFEDFKELRHSIPEHVNLKIDEMRKMNPSIMKLGSDMACKDEDLEEIMKLYRDSLNAAGLEYVIFGHIGDNHLHVNIISHNQEQFEQGKEIFATFATYISKKGGSVSAEHGIGKLKREYLELMYGKNHVNEMRNLKKNFDSKGLLCRDNIFLWNEK